MDKEKNKNKIENHKHCNMCLSVLKEIGRIGYRLEVGITTIYQCDCGIWIDEECGVTKEIYGPIFKK